MRRKGFSSIDEYIQAFPDAVQDKLQSLRRLIQKAAPEAREKISYQMPTFFLNGNLVHFGAHANHIGFYPTPSGISRFKKELSRYASSKGAVQFPLDEPLPFELVGKIVRFRVQENTRRSP